MVASKQVMQVFGFLVTLTVASQGTYQRGVVRRRFRRGWLQNAPSTGSGSSEPVMCAFNPCSVPNFCGTGRTCNMDENCIHRCECDDGSRHEKCVALEEATTPSTIKCTFDPCTSAHFACSEGRVCALNKVCMPECQCTSESTHYSCVDDKESVTKLPTTTSKVETEISECSDSACAHGQCQDSTCECDHGWSGPSCNMSLCTKRCDPGLYCHYVSATVQICIYTPEVESTSPRTSDQPGGISSRDPCSAGYVMRPLVERSCENDVTCKFGKCSRTDDDVSCVCDVFASGELCGDTCCKSCDANSTCMKAFDEREVCVCSGNHTGDDCVQPDAHLIKGSFFAVYFIVQKTYSNRLTMHLSTVL